MKILVAGSDGMEMWATRL